MLPTPAMIRRRRRQRRTILMLVLALLAVGGLVAMRTGHEGTEASVPTASVTSTPEEVMAESSTTTQPVQEALKATSTPSTLKTVHAQHPTKIAKGLDAYRGLGVWVDLYDVGAGASFQPSSVPDVAARGAQTIFLQVGRASGMAEKQVIGSILAAAHKSNLAVVAWYLPEFVDVNLDVTRVEQAYKFEYEGQRFDGITIDIEDESHVPDPALRSARLIDFSKKVRSRLPADYPLGACILPPAQIEIVSLNYWPNFPYKEIDPYYQVWQTMGYWTDRSKASNYRDAYQYTRDSVELLRTRLGRADVLVHPIGGQAAKVTKKDLLDFRRAVRDTYGIGLSIYDYATTNREHWEVLRALPDTADPNGPMPKMPANSIATQGETHPGPPASPSPSPARQP